MGTGSESTVGALLIRALRMPYLRIDTIEQALVDSAELAEGHARRVGRRRQICERALSRDHLVVDTSITSTADAVTAILGVLRPSP